MNLLLVRLCPIRCAMVVSLLQKQLLHWGYVPLLNYCLSLCSTCQSSPKRTLLVLLLLLMLKNGYCYPEDLSFFFLIVCYLLFRALVSIVMCWKVSSLLYFCQRRRLLFSNALLSAHFSLYPSPSHQFNDCPVVVVSSIFSPFLFVCYRNLFKLLTCRVELMAKQKIVP